MSISEDVAAQVLVRCARHCCICRRFMPLHIQVHHIIEQCDGGTDEFDNLIPVCIMCHSSAHTKAQMTRNFTVKELKLHRDSVYDLVEAGKLPASAQLTPGEIQAMAGAIAETLKSESSKTEVSLPEDAIEILLTAACEDADIHVESQEGKGVVSLKIGLQRLHVRERTQSQYPSSILRLISDGLAVAEGNVVKLTKSAFSYIEKVAKTTAKYHEKKVKCLHCSLHFVICTWDADRHNSKNLYCPECGHHGDGFIVWAQQTFGFIYQKVPGNADIVDISMPRKSSKEP